MRYNHKISTLTVYPSNSRNSSSTSASPWPPPSCPKSSNKWTKTKTTRLRSVSLWSTWRSWRRTLVWRSIRRGYLGISPRGIRLGRRSFGALLGRLSRLWPRISLRICGFSWIRIRMEWLIWSSLRRCWRGHRRPRNDVYWLQSLKDLA